MKRRILLLLSEKSTYTGAVTFLSSIAAFGLDEGFWSQAATALAGVAGLLTMLFLDNGDKEILDAERNS